jgi:hypothetical protein
VDPRDRDQGVDYDEGMDRGVLRIRAFIARALLGAFTGFSCAVVMALIATDDHGVRFLEEFAKGHRLLVGGALTASGAIVAVLFGTWELPGRTGKTLKGMTWGTVVGLLAGASLGFVLGSPSKSFEAAAAWLINCILLSLYVCLIVGGVIGGTAPIKPEKKTRLWAVYGVHDPEIDG